MPQSILGGDSFGVGLKLATAFGIALGLMIND